VSVVKRAKNLFDSKLHQEFNDERTCARGKYKAFLRRSFLKEYEKEFILTLINNTVSTTEVNGMRQVSYVITF
jgi:hypothetical protein